MQGALPRFVAIGQMSTSGAGTVVVIAVMGQYEGHRQVVGIDDTLSGVGDIFTAPEHEMVSWKRRFGRVVSMPSLALSIPISEALPQCPILLSIHSSIAPLDRHIATTPPELRSPP